MKLDFDLKKLPKEYHYNKENFSEHKYVDDNSLFLYQLLKHGRFSSGNPTENFFYFKPFEWTQIDFIAFLLSVSREYGLEISDVRTNFSAIKDDYEVSYDPKLAPEVEIVKRDTRKNIVIKKPAMSPKEWASTFDVAYTYGGAYKWVLDNIKNADASEETKLFERFYTDTATSEDLERAMIYATRTIALNEEPDTRVSMSKELFGKIVDWTSFAVGMTTSHKEKISTMVESYMDDFIKGNLQRNSLTKRIANTSVGQSRNIFTFRKHSLLFREYLQKMNDDFGNTVTIFNTFEDGFPNESPDDKDIIRLRYENRNFLFIHILFAFEKLGLIKVLSLGNNWDYHEDRLITYQSKIKILESFLNEEATKKLGFDADKSRFYVQGKEIKLLKFKDEYHTLRIMFENKDELAKEWFFSEIAERIDKYKIEDKKYYNAIYQLRLKLEKQGVKEFFLTTKQSVKINQKYLS